MSRAIPSKPATRISVLPLTLVGAAALILGGSGTLSAPASAVSSLVAMGTWPPVALPGLNGAGDGNPRETAGLVRIVPDRAGRAGGRPDLAGRQSERADQAERPKQAERAQPAKRARHAPRTRAQLIELRWARQRTPSAAGYWLPTHNYQLTARFGAGGGLWSGMHAGLDFAAPAGTVVRTVAGGQVIEAGWDGSYGWRIAVRHRDGTETWYCHLSEMLITDGRVTAGQRIGRVGSTGNSTGPHLHFEVHPHGRPAVDPLSWLDSHGLDAARLAFRADRDLP